MPVTTRFAMFPIVQNTPGFMHILFLIESLDRKLNVALQLIVETFVKQILL